MSPFGIASSLYSLLQTASSEGKSRFSSPERTTGPLPSGTDFSSSLMLRLATLQSQSVNTLLGFMSGTSELTGRADFSSVFDPLPATGSSLSFSGISPDGRNLSLFDPESAYRMMSVINTADVTYKAQFAELSTMQLSVGALGSAAGSLAGFDNATESSRIKQTLLDFSGQYNEWIGRFRASIDERGVLKGSQAAEISIRELEQSIRNVFNGAANGFRGLSDIGLTIDPASKRLVLDNAKLDAVLASNKPGVVDTLAEFGANFAKSAELLNADGNFIPGGLSNLDRAIDYLAENLPALRSEFGLGDPARPSARIASALAAYQRIAGA